SRFWCGAQFHIQVTFSPDGSTILVAHRGGVFVFDATTGKVLQHISAVSITSLSVSPDGKYLSLSAIGRGDGPSGGIQIWDIATGNEVRRIKDHPGSAIYRIFLTEDGKVLATQAFTQEGEAAAPYSRDNKMRPVYHADNRVYLWDAATGKKLPAIEVPLNP